MLFSIYYIDWCCASIFFKSHQKGQSKIVIYAVVYIETFSVAWFLIECLYHTARTEISRIFSTLTANSSTNQLKQVCSSSNILFPDKELSSWKKAAASSNFLSLFLWSVYTHPEPRQPETPCNLQNANKFYWYSLWIWCSIYSLSLPEVGKPPCQSKLCSSNLQMPKTFRDCAVSCHRIPRLLESHRCQRFGWYVPDRWQKSRRNTQAKVLEGRYSSHEDSGFGLCAMEPWKTVSLKLKFR